MSKTPTATGAFDDIVGDAAKQRDTNGVSPEDQETLNKMYPEMQANIAREESADPFPLMTKQRADAEERSQAEFELTMTGTKGAEIRAANRARLEEISRAAILYPSQGEQLQAEADALLDKFEREDGTNWLDVE